MDIPIREGVIAADAAWVGHRQAAAAGRAVRETDARVKIHGRLAIALTATSISAANVDLPLFRILAGLGHGRSAGITRLNARPGHQRAVFVVESARLVRA